jgi:hypothetical protein
MAYIDFNMRPSDAVLTDPKAPAKRRDVAAPATLRIGTPRIETPHAAYLVGGAIVSVIAALLFALAWVSIGQPITAAIVTILLLLPAASLLSGDGRRHA